MAEDDDEEGFGDFKFAPSNLNYNQTTAVVESNDDWSDFITTRSDEISVGFELSNGFSHTQSPPVPSLNQKPSDPFGNFVGNASVPRQVESVSSRAEPVKGTGSRWAKPRGALPLSLFGEIEENEKSGFDGPKVGDNAFDVLNKKDDSTKKGLNSSVRVGIDDLIANLYNQSPQIKAPNGFNPPPDLNILKSNMNGSSVNFDALNSITNGLNLIQNGVDSNSRGVDLDVMRVDSTVGGINFTSNGLNSNSQQQSGDFDDDDDCDNDGWEFRGAEPDKLSGNEVPEENGIVELPGLKVETNTQINQEIQNPALQSSSASLKFSNLKVDGGNGKENAEESSKAIRFDNGANGSTDKLTPSNGTSHPTGDWDFGFDLKPSSANQDEYFSNSSPKSDMNDTDSWSKLSPAVNVDLSSYENFLQSKDAVLEAAAKPKSEQGKDGTSHGLGGSALDFREIYNPTDLFAAPKGHAQKSGDWDFTFTFNSGSVAQDGTMSDPYSSNKKDDIAKGVGFFPDNKHDESDDDFGDFRDAFSETGSKHEGELMVGQSPANINSNAFDDPIQKNNLNFQKYQEALPLSIFGDEAQEADSSSVHQEVPIDNPFAYSNNGIKGPIPSVSINDLISSLYSQTEQNASESSKPDTSENKTHSTVIKSESDPVNHDDDFVSTVAQDKIPVFHLEHPLELESNCVNHDDDFDDASWEFKDAFAGNIARDQVPVVHLEDPPRKSSNKLELNDFLDLYCKLKDESCFTALSHLEILKKAESSATFSGDEANAGGVEIQKFYDQLREDNLIPTEFQPESIPSGNTHCSELLEVLQEPKFGVFESEYQLLGQLSLAEKDLRSAVELSKHAASTLRILKLGSKEQQSIYVSTWFKMVSMCAQELKHGTFVWKQSLRKNIPTEILSVPQGRKYFLSLGEIYRVVQVLGFSAKKYKPWVLLSFDGPTGLFSLLSECANLWSSSGLDSILQSISDTADCEHSKKAKALLESIKFLDDIYPLALQNPILSGQSVCRLSLLTVANFPGMKTTIWNGEHYLLILANLWANLICSDPPDLPHLNVS